VTKSFFWVGGLA